MRPSKQREKFALNTSYILKINVTFFLLQNSRSFVYLDVIFTDPIFKCKVEDLKSTTRVTWISCFCLYRICWYFLFTNFGPPPPPINFVHGYQMYHIDIFGHMAAAPGPLDCNSRGARPRARPSLSAWPRNELNLTLK